MSDYDKDFEADVLAQCLIDKRYMREAAPVLEKRHFILPEHSWVWKILRERWQAAGELVRPALFRSRLDSDPLSDPEKRVRLETILKLYKREPQAPHTSLDELRRFIRTVRLQSAIEASVKLQEKGEWDDAYNPIVEVVRTDIQRAEYQVSNWSEEFQMRQRERRHRRENPAEYRTIPTGIAKLDATITGAAEGELCGIMAVTNRGKSALAVNFGFTAVAHGYGVIHFSTEMGHKKVAQRYDSRFTRFEYRKFKRFDFSEAEVARLDKIFERSAKRFQGRLKIVSTPLRSCTIGMLRNAIEALRPEMPRLDMIIVDSGDHLQAKGRFEKAYLAEASNFWDLKDLAEELELPIWVTLQATREFETKIASTAAAAGSYDKSRICDILLSINEIKASADEQSSVQFAGAGRPSGGEIEGEGEGKGLRRLKLYLAKNRDDASRTVIHVEADLKRMLIRGIDEGAVVTKTEGEGGGGE